MKVISVFLFFSLACLSLSALSADQCETYYDSLDQLYNQIDAQCVKEKQADALIALLETQLKACPASCDCPTPEQIQQEIEDEKHFCANPDSENDSDQDSDEDDPDQDTDEDSEDEESNPEVE